MIIDGFILRAYTWRESAPKTSLRVPLAPNITEAASMLATIREDMPLQSPPPTAPTPEKTRAKHSRRWRRGQADRQAGRVAGRQKETKKLERNVKGIGLDRENTYLLGLGSIGVG